MKKLYLIIISIIMAFCFAACGESKKEYSVAVTENIAAAGDVTGEGDYEEFSEVTLTATTNDGYLFLGWYDGATLLSSDATYTFVVVGDVTVEAKWEGGCLIVVTKNIDGAGTVTGAGTYDYGTDVTLVATTESGYRFIGWYQEDTLVSSNETYTFKVYGDVSWVATWARTYSVAVTENIATAGDVTGAGTYDDGAQVTLTATPNIGYAFLGWYDGETLLSTNESYTFVVDADVAFEAKWAEIYSVAVTKNVDAAGSVTGAGDHADGSQVTLTATTNSGYLFLGWYDGETLLSSDATYTFVVDGNVTVEAKWAISRSVIVTKNIATAGSVTGVGDKPHGSAVTLTAMTNSGYTFLGWYNGETELSTDATYTFVVDADVALEARWSGDCTVVVTKNIATAGSVTGAGSVAYGTDVTLTATSNDGYTFSGWYDGATLLSSDATYTFKAKGDVTVEAKWSGGCTITVNRVFVSSTEGGTLEGSGSVTGAGEYTYGEQVTLTVTLNNGYRFLGWYDGDTLVSSDRTYTFVADGDRVLTAKVKYQPWTSII